MGGVRIGRGSRQRERHCQGPQDPPKASGLEPLFCCQTWAGQCLGTGASDTFQPDGSLLPVTSPTPGPLVQVELAPGLRAVGADIGPQPDPPRPARPCSEACLQHSLAEEVAARANGAGHCPEMEPT